MKDIFWQSFLIAFLLIIAVFSVSTIFVRREEPSGTASFVPFEQDPFERVAQYSVSDPYLYPDQRGTYTQDFETLLNYPQVALPYSLTFSSSDKTAWVPLWGTQNFTDAFFSVRPFSTSTSASAFSVFRSGTSWKDYRATADVELGTGVVLSLAARVHDEKNFVECIFSYGGSYARIIELKNGNSTDRGSTPELAKQSYDASNKISYAIEVKQDTVRCYINGIKVLEAKVPSIPVTGSVGVETWDSVTNPVPHRILKFTVTPL